MGSFVELNLALTFAPETPEYVLGAFRDWTTGEAAPELSSAFDSALADDGFDADMHLANYAGEDADLMGPLSLLQRAAVWRYLMSWGSNAYFSGTPSTALRWDRYGERWSLTTRTLPKEWGQRVQAIVAPLGELAIDGTPERPRFVGYILDESSPRPVLIWSTGREPFRFEGEFAD
jgi:hypothetical protein